MSNFYEIRTQVIAKAWKDPSFKEKLLKNPKAALKEMGYALPENVNVKCIEESKNVFTLVIPSTPSDVQKLTEAELSEIAGGQQIPLTPRIC
jgi:hypothetical protein